MGRRHGQRHSRRSKEEESQIKLRGSRDDKLVLTYHSKAAVRVAVIRSRSFSPTQSPFATYADFLSKKMSRSAEKKRHVL